jgi:hypothetical protein
MERTRRRVWAWWLVPLLLLATAPEARGDHLPVVALSVRPSPAHSLRSWFRPASGSTRSMHGST